MADTNNDPPPPAEPPASPRQRAELRISGQVQGVYYRSAASEQARVLGLRGTVRNLPGGEVELIAEGPAVALLASDEGGVARLVFARSSGESLVAVDCGALLRAACEAVEGRGGGKPDFAQGGGPNAGGIDAALAAAKAMVG